MSEVQVLKSIAAVAKKLSQAGIAKGRTNQQQGFKFRGIDEVLNAISPMLADEGLIMAPKVLSREVTERTTKSGGALFYVVLMVEYTIYSAVDGSSVSVVTCGEAMDSGDKATNKAMSAAYKYMVIQTYCVPTEGDNDADATTHEVAASKPAAKPQGSLEDRAKGMNAPAKDGRMATDGRIPPGNLRILDALDNMPAITAKCGEWKAMAASEGWGEGLLKYWEKRNDGFKELQREVFPE